MKCIGCDRDIEQPAAFAIMNPADIGDADPVVKGRLSSFVGMPVCVDCFVDPSHRKRTLKAHYTSTTDVTRAVNAAGSSNIGG